MKTVSDSRLSSYAALLSQYLRPQGLRVLLLAVLLFAGIALQLANPQIVRYVLDAAQAGAASQRLGLAAVLFMLFGILQSGATLAATYISEGIGWTATNALRADLTQHCLQLDMGFHNNRTPGELIERIDGDASELANFFSQLVLRVLGNGLLVAGIVAVLSREDWRMGGLAAIFVLVVLAGLQVLHSHTVQAWHHTRAASARLYGFLEERLAGTEDIRANGAVGYVLRSFEQLRRMLFLDYRRAYLTDVAAFSITHLLLVAGGVLGLGLGAFLYVGGQATIGTVYLLAYYMGLLRWPLEEIHGHVRNLQQATASMERIQELRANSGPLGAEIVAPAPATLPAGSLAVCVDHVFFHYARTVQQTAAGGDTNYRRDTIYRVPTDSQLQEQVLHDLTFDLAPGKVLGLLGRTGSGKTTLTRLLVRFYDPTQGAIRLGGVDLRQVSLADLRRRVGMVTQEVQLFQASLRDNITFFNHKIDDEQILRVLHELGLWAWYRDQPQGLDSKLGAGGAGLSAGEAQLLAFVRVFLKDPGLVILDEASSRLDPATEQLLEQAIDRLLLGRTGIIVAHRLTSVQRADEILLLEGGRVVEHGPRRQLADDPSTRFHRLLQQGLEGMLV